MVFTCSRSWPSGRFSFTSPFTKKHNQSLLMSWKHEEKIFVNRHKSSNFHTSEPNPKNGFVKIFSIIYLEKFDCLLDVIIRLFQLFSKTAINRNVLSVSPAYFHHWCSQHAIDSVSLSIRFIQDYIRFFLRILHPFGKLQKVLYLVAWQLKRGGGLGLATKKKINFFKLKKKFQANLASRVEEELGGCKALGAGPLKKILFLRLLFQNILYYTWMISENIKKEKLISLIWRYGTWGMILHNNKCIYCVWLNVIS